MNTHRSSRRLQAAAALTITATLLLAGCGNDDDRGAAGTASTAAPTPSASATTASVDPVTGTTLDPDDVTGISDLGTTPREDVFSVESPWNQRVTGATTDPNSEALLENSKVRTVTGSDGRPAEPVTVEDGVYINTQAWTVPVVADGVPTVLTCRQIKCGDGDDDITLDVPTNLDPDPLYDGWFTIFDPETRTGYDLWRARRENDNTISYHFMRTWDLDGMGFSKPNTVSARGSGLPLFAGLIRPGELERCEINHALAISLPGPAAGYYIQPASSTDGNNNSTTEPSLPEGARIVLDAGFQIERPRDTVTGRALPFSSARQKYAGCIVKALQTYGAIVVDRAAVPTLYFQKVVRERGRTPLLNGYELSSLGLEDFSVVDFTDETRHPFPPDNEDVDATTLDSAEDQTTDSQGTTPAEDER